jgi:hypothetical protein
MLADGTFAGGRGLGAGKRQYAGLGSWNKEDGGGGEGGFDPNDLYGSYRNKRSGAYHDMILKGVGISNAARGGR